MLGSGAGTLGETPLHESGLSLPAILITLSFSFFEFSCLMKEICLTSFIKVNMSSNTSINSEDPDVFFLEQVSNEHSPQRNNSPNIRNSTEKSHTHTAVMPSVSSIASYEPQILTINDDSNEPTMPYEIGRQLPIILPNLNALNLPPNSFSILATMAVVNHTEDGNDDNYSPQSPEPSEPSPISTLPLNVNTFDSWETSHTTTDDKNILLRWWTPENIILALNSYPTAAASKAEMEIEPGNVLSKRRGIVAASLRSLRTDDPLIKGHPRSINQELEL